MSFSSPVIDFPLTGIIGQNTNVAVEVAAFVLNRPTSPADTDSTDNILLKEMLWEKQYGASVSKLSYQENVSTYPNPASGVLNVSLLYAESGNVTIELLDLSGKSAVLEQPISVSQSNYKVDVSAIENGVYILKVTNGDTVSTSKVTVAH